MHIDAYEFGQIVIDGRAYRQDVIILPERVIADWWRGQAHLLQVTDLDEVLAEPPAVLIVGQGMPGRLEVDRELAAFLKERGIDLVAQPTAQAVKHFNELTPKRRVAAALHLTC